MQRRKEENANKFSVSSILEMGTRNTKTSCFVYMDTNTMTLSRNKKKHKHEKMKTIKTEH